MSKPAAEGQEHPQYQEVLDRFLASSGGPSGGPYRDDAFIADAIWVMCIEAFKDPQDTPLSKATMAIASRLMGFPELRKEWLVTFPYVWGSKENALSDGEIKRRGVAFKVWDKVKRGALVTHAIAEVAAALHVSPQKVTKDYYDWKDDHDRLAARLPADHWASNAADGKKE